MAPEATWSADAPDCGSSSPCDASPPEIWWTKREKKKKKVLGKTKNSLNSHLSKKISSQIPGHWDFSLNQDYHFNHLTELIHNSKFKKKKQLAQNIFTFLSSVPSSVSCKSCIVVCGPKWLFLFQSSQKSRSFTVWSWSGNDFLVSDCSFYLLTTSSSDSSHHTIQFLQSLSSPPLETPHPLLTASSFCIHSV